MKEFIDKLISRFEEERKLAYEVKEKCARGNMLVFDNAKGYFTGISNAIEIVNQLAEEYKVSEMQTGSESFCEWKKGESSVFPIKTNCGNSMDVNYGYEFCPYCGKKIKVATYTEGE